MKIAIALFSIFLTISSYLGYRHRPANVIKRALNKTPDEPDAVIEKVVKDLDLGKPAIFHKTEAPDQSGRTGEFIVAYYDIHKSAFEKKNGKWYTTPLKIYRA